MAPSCANQGCNYCSSQVKNATENRMAPFEKVVQIMCGSFWECV